MRLTFDVSIYDEDGREIHTAILLQRFVWAILSLLPPGPLAAAEAFAILTGVSVCLSPASSADMPAPDLELASAQPPAFDQPTAEAPPAAAPGPSTEGAKSLPSINHVYRVNCDGSPLHGALVRVLGPLPDAPGQWRCEVLDGPCAGDVTGIETRLCEEPKS